MPKCSPADVVHIEHRETNLLPCRVGVFDDWEVPVLVPYSSEFGVTVGRRVMSTVGWPVASTDGWPVVSTVGRPLMSPVGRPVASTVGWPVPSTVGWPVASTIGWLLGSASSACSFGSVGPNAVTLCWLISVDHRPINAKIRNI